jgi:hypothetical protein
MDISPKDFLKQRRPNKFSDSIIKEKTNLNRPTLESHLLNLSSRNEQDIFEQFIVSLCEVEVCPNIKPNTGPAGGGDGKTDAESYPVSADTALSLYIGFEQLKPKRAFAFAISAKKKWEAKLKLDFEKIYEDDRKLDVTYFVTNQYVKADKRKVLEKDLGEKYHTEVHILDLTWILQRVFDNKRVELAVTKLGIEGATNDAIDFGPNDTRRRRKIDELEKEIETETSSGAVNYTTVRDAINVAILSREQELPRIETEGRIDRAIRLADQYGTKNQKFMARYQKCWTAFWYFEDFQMLKNCYNDAQRHALSVGGIDSLEKLSNLHTILMTARDKNKGVISRAFFDSKSKVLLVELKKVAADVNAPSGSLFARALLAQVSITNAVRSDTPVDQSLAELETIIDECEGLPGFPFEAVTEIFSIMGGVVGDNDRYDEIFAKIQAQASKRDGEKRSAQMVLERAKALLLEDKNYKAIQLLGASLLDFNKEETATEAAYASLLLGVAYESVGLNWAARIAYINGASIETTRFYKEDEVSSVQLGLYRAIANIELRLGRVPQFLQWFEMLQVFISILPEDEWNVDKLEEESFLCDLRLGATILCCSEDANHIALISPVLSRLPLLNSLIAINYRIGREDLYDEQFTQGIKESERHKFLEDWAGQAPQDAVSDKLHYFDDDNAELSTRVIGCTVVVHFPNNILNTLTAESILACVESMLATALIHEGISTEPRFDVFIENNEDDTSYKIDSTVDSQLAILKAMVPNFNPNSISSENQGILAQSIQELSIHVISSIVMFKDTQKSLEQIFDKEKAFVRSTGFSSSFIRLANVIGYSPKYKLSDWRQAKDKPTKPGDAPSEALKKRNPEEVDFRTLKPDEISHDQLSTLSVIRYSLWEQAGWIGAWYGSSPGSDEIPLLALFFSNEEAASKIMEDWREQYGSNDERDAIRVAILRDIDSEYSADYRMGISANMEVANVKGRLVSSVTRIHTMNAESKEPLDMFIAQYKKVGAYRLTAAVYGPNGKPMLHKTEITKKILIIKTPDEVGENDPDSVLLGKTHRP